MCTTMPGLFVLLNSVFVIRWLGPKPQSWILNHECPEVLIMEPRPLHMLAVPVFLTIGLRNTDKKLFKVDVHKVLYILLLKSVLMLDFGKLYYFMCMDVFLHMCSRAQKRVLDFPGLELTN